MLHLCSVLPGLDLECRGEWAERGRLISNGSLSKAFPPTMQEGGLGSLPSLGAVQAETCKMIRRRQLRSGRQRVGKEISGEEQSYGRGLASV